MRLPVIQKWLLTALAAYAIFYGLMVLWVVTTQRSIPLGCLLSNPSGENFAGLEIRDVSRLTECKGTTPEVGDRIIQAGNVPIYSFTDWAILHNKLRRWKIDTSATLLIGKDPSEERFQSDIAVVEYPDKTRFARVWFMRPGHHLPMDGWLPLVPESTLGISVTLVWYVLQVCIVLITGVAYWNRPNDAPVRMFFALSSITLIAFVGGSHWWVIAANPLLIVSFATAAILLPAAVLHFFLVYPYPPRMLIASPVLSRGGLYLPPACTAVVVSVWIIAVTSLRRDFGIGPYAHTFERMTGHLVAASLPLLHLVIYTIFTIAAIYFAFAVYLIYCSFRDAKNALERNQVRYILVAAMFATIPIGYTIYLAYSDRVAFALGASRIPMFLASLAFLMAYGIGIARYKLMLIDQLISRGVWYYGASAALGILFAALITVGAVNVLHQDLMIFGQSTIPLALVLMTAVLVLCWGRDAVQRSLDRHFFSEKYQLDKALTRMNRVVTNVLEPDAVSESLLSSCREVLRIDQAALYLRKKNRSDFRMSSVVGRASFPLLINLEENALKVFEEDVVVQRVPQGTSPPQLLLRQLQAEAVYGLIMQGQLGGLLVLGRKHNQTAFSAEDVAFLSAMARITSVALHCATVQQDLARLNQDLQLKIDKIDDQERQLVVLHNELASYSKLNSVASTAATEEEFQRGRIKGHSPAILRVLEMVRKAAASNASVLVRGESGTGKELLAMAIHENSDRRAGPLVSVHCAALSPSLLESELFGHVKGAFTDARQDKVGRFQLADGGTLFLDEIGDISLEVQIKLLRVLQERIIEPVGSTKPVPVNVRIVAATHRNLEQLIQEGKFREDLFYRLNVISVTLPALRERREDLFELAIHFLRRAAELSGKQILKLDDDAFQAIQAYHWPGNIRELQNVMERAVVLAEGSSIRLADLPAEVRAYHSGDLHEPVRVIDHRPQAESQSRPRQIPLKRKPIPQLDNEKGTLETALEECNGNKAEAARMLGMPRSTFFSKLKKHGLN